MNSSFFKQQVLIIGAVHFMPLPGFVGYQGIERTLEKAKEDTEAFLSGGVDALIFENNYDYPHTISITDEVEHAMIELIKKISPHIPFGISVLWNDYKAALRIAKATGGIFIRVPVFVDRVKTQYGIVEPNPQDVIKYRKEINAEDVLLFTDIHVKHAEILSTMSLIESALKAIEEGTDGLVITGKWTGDAPHHEDLKSVREIVKDFPIIIGSGASEENIAGLLTYADAVIVSTALKSGQVVEGEVNLKLFSEQVDPIKVKSFMRRLRGDETVRT